jgi:hypothetical protein
MKNLLVLLLLIPSLALAHPIKMSLIYMDYTGDDHTLFLEFRLFADDLAMAVQEEMGTKIQLYKWSLEDRLTVNNFINKHVKITFGQQNLNLDPYEFFFEKDQKVVTMRYEYKPITLVTGQQVTVKNDLFFKQFSYGQTNVLQIEIPRVAETMIQSDLDNSSITFTITE